MGVEVFLCMKYPKFLNEKYNTIGVCAMSSGVGHKLDSFDASIEYIQPMGFILLKQLVFVIIVNQVLMPKLVLMN